jgi:hypothetical protein
VRAPVRYGVELPPEIHAELRRAAEERRTTVAVILRQILKLGLLAIDLERDPSAALVVREGEREREVVLL